jgi:hypothetical protein
LSRLKSVFVQDRLRDPLRLQAEGQACDEKHPAWEVLLFWPVCAIRSLDDGGRVWHHGRGPLRNCHRHHGYQPGCHDRRSADAVRGVRCTSGRRRALNRASQSQTLTGATRYDTRAARGLSKRHGVSGPSWRSRPRDASMELTDCSAQGSRQVPARHWWRAATAPSMKMKPPRHRRESRHLPRAHGGHPLDECAHPVLVSTVTARHCRCDRAQ